MDHGRLLSLKKLELLRTKLKSIIKRSSENLLTDRFVNVIYMNKHLIWNGNYSKRQPNKPCFFPSNLLESFVNILHKKKRWPLCRSFYSWDFGIILEKKLFRKQNVNLILISLIVLNSLSIPPSEIDNISKHGRTSLDMKTKNLLTLHQLQKQKQKQKSGTSSEKYKN